MLDELHYEQTELVCVLVRNGLGNQVMNTAKQNGIRHGIAFLGNFKEKNEVLSFLELCTVRTEVVMLVCEKGLKHAFFEQLSKTMRTKGVFITFAIPLSTSLGRCLESNYFERGGVNKGMYNTVIAIVDRGEGASVIDAANEAGARGGVIINARGLGSKESPKVFGVDIVPAKELIVIVVKNELVEEVVLSIRDKLKFDESERGVIFVQDVDDVYGAYG